MYTQGLREGACKMFGMVLDGATQVTLNCYHSGGSADPWPLDDWCTPLPEPPTARGPPWHA